MTLILYHKRHKDIIRLENVDKAQVVYGGFPNYSKRLRVIQNGVSTMYQADLYMYRWERVP